MAMPYQRHSQWEQLTVPLCRGDSQGGVTTPLTKWLNKTVLADEIITGEQIDTCQGALSQHYVPGGLVRSVPSSHPPVAFSIGVSRLPLACWQMVVRCLHTRIDWLTPSQTHPWEDDSGLDLVFNGHVSSGNRKVISFWQNYVSPAGFWELRIAKVTVCCCSRPVVNRETT